MGGRVYPRGVSDPEPIRFRAGDLTLAGELVLPDRAPTDSRRQIPWVLLLPSWLPRDRDGAFDDGAHPEWFGVGPMAPHRPALLRRLAGALAETGVASFRYDPRGCGESEGDWPAGDLFTRIDDARDALGAMRSRRELDLARTGIIGHGEGAVIALSVAIADPAVGALTLIGAPARSLRDLLRRGAAARARSGTDREHPLVAALDRWSEELIERAERRELELILRLPGAGRERVTLNLAAWEQGFHTPAIALATMLHRSVNLVHGAADAWSHPDESRLLEFVLAGAGNRAELRPIAEAGHDLTEAPERVIAEIAEDLAGRLVTRPLPAVLLAIQEMG
ncbi:MAG: alpha/beta fold hydrolase [Chloroflexi bacterium]|nr:MAG: alpha/beta fold hydrolase [Chloroflexota bacterium]